MTRRYSQLVRNVVAGDLAFVDLVQYRRRLVRRVLGPAGLQESLGADFDGTNDYLIGNNFFGGAFTSKKGTFSLWLKPHANGSFQSVFFAESLLFGVQMNPAGVITVSASSFAPIVGLIVITSSPTTLIDEVWSHVMCSWDLNVPITELWINDVDVNDHTTEVDGLIQFTVANSAQDRFTIGATASPGADKIDTGVAECYFNHDEFLDLQVKSNRRKFVTAQLKPVFLGDDGIVPTGTVPRIYCRGGAASFPTNRGSGPNFAEQGALSNIAFGPGGG